MVLWLLLLELAKPLLKLLKLTFGRFLFYKAVYALTKEGKLNLFRYHFTIKGYVLLYIFFFFSSPFFYNSIVLKMQCCGDCFTNASICGKLSPLSCFCHNNQVTALCKQLV